MSNSNYMTELDAWLTDLLTGSRPPAGESPDEWLAKVKKALKDKVLQSYRNGQRARRPKNESASQEA